MLPNVLNTNISSNNNPHLQLAVIEKVRSSHNYQTAAKVATFIGVSCGLMTFGASLIMESQRPWFTSTHAFYNSIVPGHELYGTYQECNLFFAATLVAAISSYIFDGQAKSYEAESQVLLNMLNNQPAVIKS